MATNGLKNKIFRIYCWYEHFDTGNYSVPPYTTLILFGHTLAAVFLFFYWLFLAYSPPSRDVFYSFFIGKVLFSAYIVLVWVFPLITGVIMAASNYYDKMIHKKEYNNNVTKIRNRLKKTPTFIKICISMFLFVMPYFLTIILIVFFELFVYC